MKRLRAIHATRIKAGCLVYVKGLEQNVSLRMKVSECFMCLCCIYSAYMLITVRRGRNTLGANGHGGG